MEHLYRWKNLCILVQRDLCLFTLRSAQATFYKQAFAEWVTIYNSLSTVFLFEVSHLYYCTVLEICYSCPSGICYMLFLVAAP